MNVKQEPSPLTPEQEEWWRIHKDCDLAKREHKFQWKVDIATGQPHATEAFCVHCGRSASITSKGVEIHAAPH